MGDKKIQNPTHMRLGASSKKAWSGRMTRLLPTCVMLTVMSACSVTSSSDRILFDGKYFRANARSVDKRAKPTDFTVTVNGVSESLDGAREAGRYEATRFCVQNFGSSKIDWQVGPDSEPQTLRIENDKLTFAGKCQRP